MPKSALQIFWKFHSFRKLTESRFWRLDRNFQLWGVGWSQPTSIFYIGSRKLYITVLSRSHAHMPLSQGVTLCQYFCHFSPHNHGSSKVSLASRGAISTSMIMGGRLFSCFVFLGEGCHRFFPCRLTVYRWRFPLGGWAPITPVNQGTTSPWSVMGWSSKHSIPTFGE